jgi:hypothetical protein
MSWLKRVFSGNKEPKPEIMRIPVQLDSFIKKMKEPKDLRLIISEDGTVKGHCKACDTVVQTGEKDELLWFVCPQCGSVSFNPLGNRDRDLYLAREHGGTFEYELYYLRDLPPALQPPPSSDLK